MPQDAFTLRRLCIELDALFKKGKINKINQPSDDKVIFTVYTGKKTEKLLIDVNPSGPRIGVIKEEKENLLTALNFCMLLRKHLLSAEINKIELLGFDRIVKITLTSRADFKDDKTIVLYVELMGRYSNIILTENDLVLGANRGINMIYNGVRPIIFGKPYILPPVNSKKEPKDLSLIDDFNSFDGEDLSLFITEKVQGIALSTAKEIVDKYYKEKKTISFCAKDFFCFFNEFLYGENSRPCVVKNDGKIKDVCAIDYQTITGEKVFFDKLYLAEEYYYNAKTIEKEFSDIKTRVLAKINTALKKSNKKLSSFLSKEKDCDNMEENRIKGELVLSNIYRIKQGDKSVKVENYYDEGKVIEIPLDEKLSPSKNSENYYKKYNKQKRALETLKPFKSQVLEEIDYLNSVLFLIQSAETLTDVESVLTELKEYGLVDDKNRQKTIKKVIQKPYRNYSFEGFTIRVGKNNIENDQLVQNARGTDVWLHAKDYHSSHVVIETNGAEVPEKVLVFSAQIGAYYSKGKDGGKVEMVYTLKKHVKKPNKSKPGFVTYDNFKSLTVIPEKHAEYLK